MSVVVVRERYLLRIVIVVSLNVCVVYVALGVCAYVCACMCETSCSPLYDVTYNLK